ncbi:hypothetical protein QUB13_08940 [Microcoleus sp. B4-D4]
MVLVKSHSFSVWSDETEIALSPSGVMATAQTSPEWLPSVLSSLSARSTRRHRSEASLTALLHWFGGFLNAVGSHRCLMRKKERSHANPPSAETHRFGREVGKEQAQFHSMKQYGEGNPCFQW